MKAIGKLAIATGIVVATDAAALTGMRLCMSKETKQATREVTENMLNALKEKATGKVSGALVKGYSAVVRTRLNFVCGKAQK